METVYKVCLGTVLVLCVLLVFRLVAACRQIILFVLVLNILRLLLDVVKPFHKDTILREIQTVSHTAGPYCRSITDHLEQICSYRRLSCDTIMSPSDSRVYFVSGQLRSNFLIATLHILSTFQIPCSTSFSVISRSCPSSFRFRGQLCRDPSKLSGSVFCHG